MSDSSDSAPHPHWWKLWVPAPRLFVVSIVGFAVAAAVTAVWLVRLGGTREFAGWMTAPVALVVAILGLASVAGLLAAIMQTRRDGWLAVALFVVLAASLWQPLSSQAVGQGFLLDDSGECPVSDFALQDTDGNVVRLSDLRGRVVLIEVWGTWCNPCIAELPYLTYANRLLGEEGLTILGISDEPAEIQQPVLDEYGVSYPMLIDDGSLPRPFAGVTSYPSTFLIDREGCLVDRHIRGVEGLRRLIREVRGRDEELPLLSLRERSPAVAGGDS